MPPVSLKSPAFEPLILSPIGREIPYRLMTLTFLVFDDEAAPALSATGYGLSGSGLSETDSVADSVPRAPGVNVTLIEHLASAARVAPQVPPLTEKSAALVPPKVLPSVT